MKYTTLLLDLDGTLFDFDACEMAALKKTLKENDIEPDPYIIKEYIRINKSMWEALERKEITIEMIQKTRFQVLFDELHLDRKDGEKVSTDYRLHLSKEHQLFDGVHECLKRLKKQYKLVVCTNGFYTTQMERLKDSGLTEVMDHIFISGKMGVQKPAIEFFDMVFAEIKEPKENCLMIGDSLTSDIRGANNYHLDSLWINAKENEIPDDNKPVYVLKQFTDIETILNRL